VFVTPVVIQEVLQGARDEREWRLLDEHLATQPLVHPHDPLASHRDAARIYFECRRRGLTVRSTIDCYIAALALEHGLPLLHDDRDYEAIARVRPLQTLP
jgi:predicted nucleic acid-binding protein